MEGLTCGCYGLLGVFVCFFQSQDADGTRLTQLPDGRWSIEMEGLPHILASPTGLSLVITPGLTLQYTAPEPRSEMADGGGGGGGGGGRNGGVVCASLPDGCKIMACGGLAVFLPQQLAGRSPEQLRGVVQARRVRVQVRISRSSIT
jgi:hypothetical protein